MFPNLHPAAMVSPMGMGLAFNPQVPMQPHMRVPGPGSFMSGGGFYGPSGFNGAPVPSTKSGSNSTPITHQGMYIFTKNKTETSSDFNRHQLACNTDFNSDNRYLIATFEWLVPSPNKT